MDYIYILAWHKGSSFPYYIESLIEKARAEQAPATAVYYDSLRKQWICLEECAEETQKRIKARVAAIMEGR